jgi:hypothetical protein
MAITNGENTGATKTSASKKVVGYFNLDMDYKLKGEVQTKRIGGITHWAKDPTLHALFEMLEKNPDKEITLKLSVKRNAVEVDVNDIEF